MTMKIKQLALAAAAASFLLPITATTAFAQEACGESTCDKGYTCEEGLAPCPLVLCVEGEECPQCESETIEYCVPMECESDDECADYMTCATFETQECPETYPECTEDDSEEECSAMWADWEAQCVDAEIHQCTPRFHQECEEAADCGEGFECMPNQVVVDCRGNAENDEPVECEYEDGDTGYCSAIEQACEEDSDCLENWTCGENYNQFCEADEDGNFECSEADPPKVCYPPEPGGGGGFIALAADGATTSGAASSGVADLPEGAPVAQASSVGGAESEDELELPSADESDESPVVGDTNEESAPDGDTGDEMLEESGGSSSSNSGCSVANAASHSGGGLPALLVGLGLVLGGLRRRRG